MLVTARPGPTLMYLIFWVKSLFCRCRKFLKAFFLAGGPSLIVTNQIYGMKAIHIFVICPQPNFVERSRMTSCALQFSLDATFFSHPSPSAYGLVKRVSGRETSRSIEILKSPFRDRVASSSPRDACDDDVFLCELSWRTNFTVSSLPHPSLPCIFPEIWIFLHPPPPSPRQLSSSPPRPPMLPTRILSHRLADESAHGDHLLVGVHAQRVLLHRVRGDGLRVKTAQSQRVVNLENEPTNEPTACVERSR